MQAVPRKYGRLAYTLSPNLDAILAELSAGRPVLVLHNYGVPFFPRWHYAVVVGYDALTDRLTLRSGVTRRQVLSAKSFMRAWDNGGRWSMVLLRPGETAATANPVRYVASAADFERVANAEASRKVFDAAVQRWPDQPVAWIGRGTAEYRMGDLRAAAQDYASALRVDPNHVGARNNLAQTLLDLGCPRRAHAQLANLEASRLEPPIRTAVLDTRQHIDAALTQTRSNSDAALCQSLPN